QTALFYNLDFKIISLLAEDVTLGALQDNGVVRRSVLPFVKPGDEWTLTDAGDGWDVAFDGGTLPPPFDFLPTNKAVDSGSGDLGGTFVKRSDDLGSTWGPDIAPWRNTPEQSFMLATTIRADPNNSGFWYTSGSQNLWQTRDSGDNWRILATFGGPGPIDVAA